MQEAKCDQLLAFRLAIASESSGATVHHVNLNSQHVDNPKTHHITGVPTRLKNERW